MSGSKSGGNTGAVASISRYSVGLQFVLCHGPVDSIGSIVCEEKDAYTTPITTSGDITIEKPDLFGGATSEGGVEGTVYIGFGEPSQAPSAYLEAMLGDMPAYRGLVTVLFKRVYIGHNYYLKPWKFKKVQRIHKLKHGEAQWYDAKAAIATKLINPIHVIRECFTNTTWGMGYDTATLNNTSFTSAADTCYAEGLGFSWLYSSSDPVYDFIGEVLTHVQGTIYVDRITGLINIYLLRAGATSEITLNKSNIIDISAIHQKRLGDVASIVNVKYKDIETGLDGTATASDISLINRQGAPISKDLTYSGCVTPEIAQTLAIRGLQQYSFMGYSMTITCKRVVETLHEGSLFTLNYPDLLDYSLPMRVVSINLGTNLSNKIVIEAIQDIFYDPVYLYNPPPVTIWTNPVSTPVVATHRIINELPYYMIARSKGDSYAQALDPDVNFFAIAGAAPSGDSIAATVYATTGTDYTQYGLMDFCYYGTLSSSISITATSITVSTTNNINLIGLGSFIQLGNELVVVNSISGSTITIGRGVLDTVPTPHSSGSAIFAWHDNFNTNLVEYLTGETVKVKLSTITPSGNLDITSAPYDSLTFLGRNHLPYPPGNVKINTVAYANTFSDALTISWSHRSRTQQTTGEIFDTTHGDIGPETGVTYTLRLYDETNTLRRTVVGLTTTSYLWNTEIADCGLGRRNTTIRFELESVRDGLVSWQKHNLSITRTGSTSGSDTETVNPTSLASTSLSTGIQWTWSSANAGTDKFQIIISPTNDRDDASAIITDTGLILSYTKTVDSGTYYAWVRSISPGGALGDWVPSSSTAGISGTPISDTEGLIDLIGTVTP